MIKLHWMILNFTLWILSKWQTKGKNQRKNEPNFSVKTSHNNVVPNALSTLLMTEHYWSQLVFNLCAASKRSQLSSCSSIRRLHSCSAEFVSESEQATDEILLRHEPYFRHNFFFFFSRSHTKYLRAPFYASDLPRYVQVKKKKSGFGPHSKLDYRLSKLAKGLGISHFHFESEILSKVLGMRMQKMDKRLTKYCSKQIWDLINWDLSVIKVTENSDLGWCR